MQKSITKTSMNQSLNRCRKIIKKSNQKSIQKSIQNSPRLGKNTHKIHQKITTETHKKIIDK